MAKTTNTAPLIERLGLDPESDLGKWVQQQYEAGVKNCDVMTSIAEAGSITPAKFRRVRLDE